MSTAAAATDAAPPKKGKKKLIIIIAAVVGVLLMGGVGAVVMMKKNAAHAAEAEADGEEQAGAPKKAKAAKNDPKAVPVFVPLDPFTVNLADREAERYAQVGITLEVAEAALEAQIKAFMPIIRNNILLALADSTASELMGREGKAKLAVRIQTETSRALGVEIEDAPEEEPQADAEDAPKKKKRKKPVAQDLPITGVHFSNFIIQ
jgi:flagellar FliL protein